jgi:hypothetical protein
MDITKRETLGKFGDHRSKKGRFYKGWTDTSILMNREVEGWSRVKFIPGVPAYIYIYIGQKVSR